jgi:peptide/nickel transport system substrate-binding protein
MRHAGAPSRPLDRRRFLGLSAGALAAAATGCGRRKDPATARGDTLISAYAVGDGKLGGGMYLAPWGDDEAQMLVSSPLILEEHTGELAGRLAQHWEHSGDYREWTYYLRPGVHWHDGVPLTARDVKFSFELLSHPDVMAITPGNIESITVPSDSTVTVRYAKPSRAETWWGAYPKHLLERLDPKQFREWEFWTHPVGNGPYRVVRNMTQTLVELEANPGHYLGEPRIKRVVLRFVGVGAVTELLSGAVDLVPFTNPALTPKIAADPRFKVYHRLADHYWHAIYWRTRHPLFSDRTVRHALTLAIDRRELMRVLYLPDAMPVADVMFSSDQLRRHEIPEPLPYDPARAESLLEAAGWRDRDAAGVRQRNGLSFRFTALVSGRLEGPQAMALYVQQAFRRIGIHMDILTQQDRSQASRAEAWIGMLSLPQLAAWFAPSSPFAYDNPGATALVARAQAAADPDARNLLHHQLGEVFQAEMPVTILMSYVDTYFAHRRLRGLGQPFSFDPMQHMDELWLDNGSDA